MCRPNACKGFTCLCDVGFMVSRDSFSCIKASRVGEQCHPKETLCISPFSGCLETCQCYDAFVPTLQGQCKLASASFVGESCGTMGCEYPAKCIAGKCTCMPPFRSMTEEEFWVDPLITMQCQREDFSLWKCNGTLIDIPEEMRTTTSTTTEPTTTTEMKTTATTETIIQLTTTTEAITTTTTEAVITTTTTETMTTETPTTTTALVTTITTTGLTTTTDRMKVNVFDGCRRHEECPDNSKCRPNSCEGFVCLCREGYLSSADKTQCLIASRIGDFCDDHTKCMSPFAGCQSTCKCYDLFVASADGRCKLWSSAFVGEPCGEKGCEFPAKCSDGICQCVAPYRKMTTEEFWVNPLETSQCHDTNFSLVMCKGKYIDVPEPLSDEWQELLKAKRLAEMGTSLSLEQTTEVTPTTKQHTTVPSTLSWLQAGNDDIGADLNKNPNSRKLYTPCTSHSQCPTSARCRPNACEGFVCLCEKYHTASDDNSFCFHAVKIGDTCNKKTDKCLSPFANCAGKCQCYSPFIPTNDGRCRHPMAAFVGEFCGGRIGCEYPATCEEGVCACLKPQRKPTEEEAWIYPLRTKQCHETSFSTMLCEGKLIQVPEELSHEWADFIMAYRSKLGLTTPSSTTVTTIETTPKIETSTSPTSTAGYESDLSEPCATHGQCPTNSRCRPRSCDGYVCICDRGYLASDDRKTCLKAIRVGEKCNADTDMCVSPFAACAGVCRCYQPFVPSYDGRCKTKTANFIGENCGSKGCDHPGSCISGTCQCRKPYRKKTAEEFWANPLTTSLCSKENFSLRECNGVPIHVPGGLVDDAFYSDNTTYWPDGDDGKRNQNNTELTDSDSDPFLWKLFTTPPSTGLDGLGDASQSSGSRGSKAGNNLTRNEPSWWDTGSGSGHSFMNRDDWRKNYDMGQDGSEDYNGLFPFDTNLDWGKSNIQGRCYVHEQCPDHSYCGPMACDGYVCLCNPGYVPSDDRTSCLAAVLVGDECNPADSNCLSPFADCDGTCSCYDVFETSQDRRCRTKTAGFISDPCGGNMGCEFPATCVEGKCACADPYRRLTRREFWADLTRTRQCHKKDFALYLCDGKPVEVPHALRNVTDPFGGILNGFGPISHDSTLPVGPIGGTAGSADGSTGLIDGYTNSTDGTANSLGSRGTLENGVVTPEGDTSRSPNRALGSNVETDTLGTKSGGVDGDSSKGERSYKTEGSNGSFYGTNDGAGRTRTKAGMVRSDGGNREPNTDIDDIGIRGNGRGTSKSGDLHGGPENSRFQDTGGLYYYIPQGGFFLRKLLITSNRTQKITLSDLQKDVLDFTAIHASIYSMPYNSSDSHRSIDPDAVHQNGSGLNDTTNRLQPSYTSPSHISVTGVYHTSQTKTLDSDQVQGVISSTLSDVVKHNTDGSIFTNGMVSTSLDYPSSQKEANHNGKDMLNQNKDDFDIDSDVNQTNIEKPGQNPDVEEADMSETVLMSSSIAAVFLLNMVCIVLLITNRRRRKRKREEKARQEANERSTVSEYEVYQLACPYVTLPSAPYITITSGPYVCTSTISELESDKSKTENMTSSSGAESGYSTLPDTSTESVIDSQGSVYDDCLHIPRPHVKKDINKILDDAEVTSSVATTFPAKSRKRSSTMTYTSAKDSDIKYWFCEIPRPIVSFSKLKLKNNVTWGTWPKLESNPYVDSEASTTGNHTYEEILPSIQSDTSV